MSAVSSSTSSTVASAASKISQKLYATDLESLPEDFLKYRAEVQETLRLLITPLNLTIAALIIGLIYLRTRSQPTPTIDPTTPTVFRTFTPRTLLHFNGKPSTPHNPEGKVYMAAKGKVYDVTPGRNFYGPGGSYENFAGRDATRGLACQSFDEEMLTKDLDGPLDDCKDLGQDELMNLQSWVERFDEKYLVVGKLSSYAAIMKTTHFKP